MTDITEVQRLLRKSRAAFLDVFDYVRAGNHSEDDPLYRRVNSLCSRHEKLLRRTKRALANPEPNKLDALAAEFRSLAEDAKRLIN